MNLVENCKDGEYGIKTCAEHASSAERISMKLPIGSIHRAVMAAAVAAALMLCACGDRDREAAGSTTRAPGSDAPSAAASAAPASTAPSPGGATSPAAPSVPAMAAAGRDFVMTAASNDTFEVEAGKMALEKTQNPAVRTFAERMVDDHSETNEQLRAIARGAGITVMMSMNAENSADLERLRVLSGREFDREYAAQVGVAAHQQAVASFEQTSRSASDAQLKSFAEQTLPHLRGHLQQAQALARQVGVPADRLRLANAAGATGNGVTDPGTGNAMDKGGAERPDAISRPSYSNKPAQGG